MNILLVSCPRLSWMQESKGTIPVPLLYLASSLRQAGFSPAILDLSLVDGNTEKTLFDAVCARVEKSIADSDPAIVGFNCFVSQHLGLIMTLAKRLSVTAPHIHYTVGGAHPSLFYKEILENCSCLDSVVVGEGEDQMVALARCVDKKSNDYESIHSFAYRKNGRVVYNTRKNYIENLDRLADPAWDLISFPDYYGDHSLWHNPKQQDIKVSAPIITSRSCPFRCNFCACHKTMGRKFRKRSPKRVVDEIERLHREYGVNYFGFIDDNVNLDKSHVTAICEDIVRRHLDIQFEPTCGLHLASLDEDVVRALSKAGCVFARLPIEHGNDYIRNQIVGKNLSREQIIRVAHYMRKYGMRISTMSIMGFPEDTVKTLQDTYDMLMEVKADLNYVFNLIPFPGTRVFDQAIQEGLLLTSFSEDKIWEGRIDLDPVQKEQQFYLKPRNMTLEQMDKYREKFNEIRVMNPACDGSCEQERL